MTLARHYLLILAGLSLTVSGCKKKPQTLLGATIPSPESQEPTGLVLKPDPKMLEHLSEEFELEGHHFRPPKGYVRSSNPKAPAGSTMVAWVGERRPDETSPQFMVTLVTIPEGERMRTPNEGLKVMLRGILTRRIGWTESPAERCKIGGIQFVKSTWRAKRADSGTPMSGFLYFAIVGRQWIGLSSQDVEPHDLESLPIANAAALTFRPAGNR